MRNLSVTLITTVAAVALIGAVILTAVLMPVDDPAWPKYYKIVEKVESMKEDGSYYCALGLSGTEDGKKLIKIPCSDLWKFNVGDYYTIYRD